MAEHQVVPLDMLYVFRVDSMPDHQGGKIHFSRLAIVPALMILVAVTPCDTTLKWTTIYSSNGAMVATYHPDELRDFASAVHENELYIFGGSNILDEGFKDTLMNFNISSKSWKLEKVLGDVPLPRSGASLTLVRHSLILFGGRNLDGAFNDIYKYDIQRKKWLMGVPDKEYIPEGRCHHAASTDGSGKIHIFGGYNGNRKLLNDFFIINLDVDVESLDENTFPVRFEVLSNTGRAAPPERESATLNYVDNKLYLYGGYTYAGMDATMWVYDMQDDSWSGKISSESPEGRQGHATARLNESLVVVGGCDATKSTRRCYNDIWRWNTKTLKWSMLSSGEENFPPRQGHAIAFEQDGSLILYGGYKWDYKIYSEVISLSGLVICETGATQVCQGHGVCIRGTCQCNAEYTSHDCGELLTCPSNCNYNGYCFNGKCNCDPGFTGPSCYSESPCPGSGYNHVCNMRGICLPDHTCKCHKGYTGRSCRNRIRKAQTSQIAVKAFKKQGSMQTKLGRKDTKVNISIKKESHSRSEKNVGTIQGRVSHLQKLVAQTAGKKFALSAAHSLLGLFCIVVAIGIIIAVLHQNAKRKQNNRASFFGR